MFYTNADRVRSILDKRQESVGRADATFRLGDTDTAWNPDDTKEFIHGPGRVKYEKNADGGIVVKLSR